MVPIWRPFWPHGTFVNVWRHFRVVTTGGATDIGRVGAGDAARPPTARKRSPHDRRIRLQGAVVLRLRNLDTGTELLLVP